MHDFRAAALTCSLHKGTVIWLLGHSKEQQWKGAEMPHLAAAVVVVLGAAVLGITVSVTGRLVTSRVGGAALVVGKAVLVVGTALQHRRQGSISQMLTGYGHAHRCLDPVGQARWCASGAHTQAMPHLGTPVLVEGRVEVLVGGAVVVRATGMPSSSVVAGRAVLVSGGMVVVAGAAVIVTVVGTTVEVVGAAVDRTAAVVVVGAATEVVGATLEGVGAAVEVVGAAVVETTMEVAESVVAATAAEEMS